MEKRILLAVDGSSRGFEAVSIMGRLLKDQPELDLLLLHCVQQLASLSPGEVCLAVPESCRIPFTDQEKIGTAILKEAKSRLIAIGFPENRITTKLSTDSVDPAQDIISEADAENIKTVALGRRGRSQLQTLLLGSVSGKVAQYASDRTAWIIDTPVHESFKVLIAMEGASDYQALARYTSEFLAPNPSLQYTFLHIMPPVPPTFWDDGHILGPSEQKDRQGRIDKWRKDWVERVEKFMDESRAMLTGRGVETKNIETLILPAKEGIARDLLNEIDEHKFEMVVMGKKSLHERKPFLMGSHANKVLQNVKGAILCLIDS